MFTESQNIIKEEGVSFYTRDDSDMFIIVELECSGKSKILKLKNLESLEKGRRKLHYDWLEPEFDNKEQAFVFAEATIQ